MVSENGTDTFDRPTGVIIAPNGDVFVMDGHMLNEHNSARVVKFSKDGRFIKSFVIEDLDGARVFWFGSSWSVPPGHQNDGLIGRVHADLMRVDSPHRAARVPPYFFRFAVWCRVEAAMRLKPKKNTG